MVVKRENQTLDPEHLGLTGCVVEQSIMKIEWDRDLNNKTLVCHNKPDLEKRAMKTSSSSPHNYLTQVNEDSEVHGNLNFQNFIQNITKRRTPKSYQISI